MYKDVAKNIKTFEFTLPSTIVPAPVSDDYDVGFIYRYFLRKANDENAFIFEVSEETYNDYIKNRLWTGDVIKWRIAGPTNEKYKETGELDDRGVIASNRAAIGIASSNLKNISLYLPNLLQFHIGR